MNRDNPPSEERALYVGLAVLGTALVTAAIAARGAADTGATLGLGFLIVAIIGLASQLRMGRRGRLPGAHSPPRA